MTLYFGDLEPGSTYESSTYSLTKEEIISFAEQWDPHPFHIDEEAAAQSMFGEIVASGLHTFCLSVRLFVLDFAQAEEGVAIMGGRGVDELRFHQPVYPHDTLEVEIEVLDKRPSESRPGRGYVDFRRSTFNQDGEEVMSNIIRSIVRRKTDDG